MCACLFVCLCVSDGVLTTETTLTRFSLQALESSRRRDICNNEQVVDVLHQSLGFGAFFSIVAASEEGRPR